MKAFIGLMVLLCIFPSYAMDCDRLNQAAGKKGYLIPSWQSGRDVVGKGDLELYSAPNQACREAGKAIPANSSLDAYVDYKGFTSIMFFDPDGEQVTGWVVTTRLKRNGYGIAPRDITK